VVVVAGETGSGKTTQLPKICLDLGRGVTGLIGHTQPRRIAARAVAERIAEELHVELGTSVGYAVRFDDRVGPDTLVKVMTDGILLAEIRRDRLLRAYDTIIVDEAHERSLNIDFLLGYLTQLLPRRPDLKVIITSATIDTQRFAAHFGAPVVEVSGRTYPVEVRYRPLGAEDDSDDDPTAAPGDDDIDINQAVGAAVAELVRDGPGDVLVFLPGERDIRDAADALRESGPEGLDILPLYARLSAAEQHRVFRPHKGRRVVLATNVAETSLTVPGIRSVVDTGLARISRYNHRTKVQRLPIESISQASANQRAGRCGRIGPGICIRLFGQDDFEGRPEYTDPEILRTNLASVILQMAAIGLGPIEDFPFLDPPDRRSIADGRALLEEVGAFEDAEDGPRLTGIGRRLAELPIDPRLGRMVIEAERRDCLREVIIIAAAMSIQDPRERPTERAKEADEMHARFEVPDSDFLSYVALWDYLADLQRTLSGNQFRKRCHREYLHVLRIREWQDLAGQIRQVGRGRGVTANRDPAGPDQIHQALMSGLLSHLGMRDRVRNDYLGARNLRWSIGRRSSLSRRPPAWAMAAELVETDRTWARTVARIDPAWAERLGAHLIKRTHSEPWWEPGRGEAVVEERVTLYGLPLVAARPVGLHRMDPAEARRWFIDHALVERDWPVVVPPLTLTEERKQTVLALEERVRRRNLLAGDDVIADFYNRRLPEDITSGTRFQRWWKSRGRADPESLAVPFDVLVDRGGGPVTLADFPDLWAQGDLRLRLVYRFEPGTADDGVTVLVPVGVLNRLSPRGFDWHVAGIRPELVAALVRSVPKEVRRALGPTAEVAREVVATTSPADGDLLPVVAGRLAQMSGHPVTPAMWDRGALPPYLNVHFQAVAGDDVVAASDDLAALAHSLRPRIQAALERAAPELIRRGARAWDFGDLPRRIERGDLTGFPALVDEGGTVGVTVCDSPSAQADSMWQGTRRLIRISQPLPEAHLQRRLTNETKLALARTGFTISDLLEDCAVAVTEQVMVAGGGPQYTAAGFARLAERAGSGLSDRVARVATIAGGVLAAADLVLSAADRTQRRFPGGRASLDDVRHQIDGLVHPGFVSEAGTTRLRDLLRYLDAAGRRVERLPADARRDAERQALVDRIRHRYDEALDRATRAGDRPLADLAPIRWMIEELRVSLWAQQLGTPEPISEARIQRALDAAGA
jgi:ATP-dependent helicase HrpA